MTLRMRRGSTGAPGGGTPPPPGDVFGPTAGDQSVRDNAGARAVSDPGGGISFTSASDFQNKLTANPSGTVFVAANNISWTGSVGTTTKAPKIYIPGGRIMDGGGGAYTGLFLGDGAELHGGIWQNFGSASNSNFFPAVAASGSGALKLIQDCTFQNCRDMGMSAGASNIHVKFCTMNNNGRYGFSATEPSPGVKNTNVRFENVNCYNNNTRALAQNADAGGNKILFCRDTYVGFSWFHDNTGAGLWFDYAPGTHVVEENVMENNQCWGIHYEVGTSTLSGGYTASAVIRNNLVKNNSTAPLGDDFLNGCQLVASCSDGLANGGLGHEIHHNVVDSTAPRAIGFNDHNFHPTDQRGCHIHDNDIYLRTNSTARVGGQLASGGTQTQTYDPFAASSNNTFENNHYHVQGTSTAYWLWAGSNKTWSQWQALGHDNTGTLQTI
jgi:hypothetical protein